MLVAQRRQQCLRRPSIGEQLSGENSGHDGQEIIRAGNGRRLALAGTILRLAGPGILEARRFGQVFLARCREFRLALVTRQHVGRDAGIHIVIDVGFLFRAQRAGGTSEPSSGNQDAGCTKENHGGSLHPVPPTRSSMRH